jgi:hypothetical protein
VQDLIGDLIAPDLAKSSGQPPRNFAMTAVEKVGQDVGRIRDHR